MEQLQAIQSLPQRVKKIEFKKELFKYIRVWYWFVLSIIFFVIIAKIYLRYAVPVYNSQASVYFNTSTKKTTGVIGLNDLQSLSGGGISKNSIADEIAIMKSKPILRKVVKNLNLDVAFMEEGNIKKIELYNNSPFKGQIVLLHNEKNFGGASYKIKALNSKAFVLANLEETHPKTYLFDVPYDLGFGVVKISKNPNINYINYITVTFLNYINVASGLEGGITVTNLNTDTNIMDLFYRGGIPQKSEDILDELIRQYNSDADNDKKLEARNSAAFISERLKLITGELSNIEGKKTNFKRLNNIFDIETQVQSNLRGMDEGTQKSLEFATQLEMVNSVLRLLNQSNDQLLPTNIGVPNAAEGLISQYNDLVLLKNKTLRQATPANPMIVQFNKDLSQLKSLIKENLDKSKALISNNFNYQQGKITKFKDEMTMFPEQENFFKNIDRQQKIKESLYLYLLQKNEEISMALAVSTPKVKILNPAYTTGVIAPNAGRIMMYAYLLGGLLPLVFFFIKNSIDTYIHSKYEILEIAKDIPVVAEIPSLEKGESHVIVKNDLSSFAESFRILYSNIKYFFNKDSSCPVILISSSIKGEGKTTISVNTALTLAQTKKVLLIGADIRNPQLKRFMNLKGEGLSEYLSDFKSVPESFISESSLTSNLKLIHSGSIAPNPSELLESEKFNTLLEFAKKQFDYIVIDSAPMLMVGDTYHLVKYSDVLLFLARSEYTDKEMIEFANQIYTDHAKGKMALVLNDVSYLNLTYSNKYGYGYKHGYGYSYTEGSEKKPWWKKLFLN